MTVWHFQRIAFGALFGVIAATAVCWGGLILYGTLYLHGHGSLFDTNPSAANFFFALWFLCAAAAAGAGAYFGHRSFQRRRPHR